MQMKYYQAILGFCPNLTDPNAVAVPVASILLGEVSGARIGAVIVGMPQNLPLDPISKLVFKDVNDAVRARVDETFKADPHAPLRQILERTYDGLRNSLSMMEIDDDEQVTEIKDLGPAEIIKIAMNRLTTAHNHAAQAEHTGAPHPPLFPTSTFWPVSELAAG